MKPLEVWTCQRAENLKKKSSKISKNNYAAKMVAAARRQIIGGGGGGAPINKSRRRRRSQIVGGGGAARPAHSSTLCSGNHERVAFSCLNNTCPHKIRHCSNSICLIWDICLSLLIVNEFLSPIASNGAGSQRAISQDERPENKPLIGLLQLCLVQSQINPGVP